MKINIAIQAVKLVASGIVGIGTGKVVGKIVKENVPVETLIEKITITAATCIISAMATQATKKYTNDAIDEVVETVTTITKKFKDSGTLAKVNRGEMTLEESGLDSSKYEKDSKGKWASKQALDDELVVKNTLHSVKTPPEENDTEPVGV